jgi:hypothetical protein
MADQNPQKNMVITFDEGVSQGGKYTNAVSVHVNMNEVVLDFGYSVPNTNPPEIKIVERMNLNHRTAESFLSVLQNAMLDFRNKVSEANAKNANQQPPAAQVPPQA